MFFVSEFPFVNHKFIMTLLLPLVEKQLSRIIETIIIKGQNNALGINEGILTNRINLTSLSFTTFLLTAFGVIKMNCLPTDLRAAVIYTY